MFVLDGVTDGNGVVDGVVDGDGVYDGVTDADAELDGVPKAEKMRRSNVCGYSCRYVAVPQLHLRGGVGWGDGGWGWEAGGAGVSRVAPRTAARALRLRSRSNRERPAPRPHAPGEQVAVAVVVALLEAAVFARAHVPAHALLAVHVRRGVARVERDGVFRRREAPREVGTAASATTRGGRLCECQ